MRRLFCTAVFVFLLPIAANATTYFVDQSHPNASDGNLGIEDQPWETLQYATVGLFAGDTVRVKAGVYNRVDVQSSGEPGNPIVFEAYPGQVPTIVGGLNIYHQSHLIIRGFRIEGLGIRVQGPEVRDIVIDRNHIIDVTGSGVAVWGTPWRDVPSDYDWLGARDIIISNNILERVTNEGYNEQVTVANGVDNCEVFGNVFFDGRASGVGGETIDFKEGVTNCSIHDNEIFNSPKINIYIDGGRGTYAPRAPETRNIEIYSNYIHDNDGTGISISTEGAGTVENVYVHHNRIENQGWIGILVYIHPDNGSGELRNILIEQNEVHNSYIDNIQMNNPTAYETRIIDNLIDEDAVKVKRHPDDFYADNNGPWVVITPLDEDVPPPEHNDPPTAEPQSVVTETNASLDITLKASDPDGDPLSYNITSWPNHGALTGSGSTRRYTPDPDYSGSDGFVFSVEDGAGGSDTATADIDVVLPAEENNPPVADQQSVKTFRNTAVDITLKASDPDGDPLSYNITSWPSHGVLTGSGSARRYTPDPDYTGSDGFVFSVEDGAGGSDTATVSIDVKKGNGGKGKRRRQ